LIRKALNQFISVGKGVGGTSIPKQVVARISGDSFKGYRFYFIEIDEADAIILLLLRGLRKELIPFNLDKIYFMYFLYQFLHTIDQ